MLSAAAVVSHVVVEDGMESLPAGTTASTHCGRRMNSWRRWRADH